MFVCTWAQDERPADLHMAQPNVPVSKTGQGGCACTWARSETSGLPTPVRGVAVVLEGEVLEVLCRQPPPAPHFDEAIW
jgi:hypothetical protein